MFVNRYLARWIAEVADRNCPFHGRRQRTWTKGGWSFLEIQSIGKRPPARVEMPHFDFFGGVFWLTTCNHGSRMRDPHPWSMPSGLGPGGLVVRVALSAFWFLSGAPIRLVPSGRR